MGMGWKGKKGLSVPVQKHTYFVAETAQLHLKGNLMHDEG